MKFLATLIFSFCLGLGALAQNTTISALITLTNAPTGTNGENISVQSNVYVWTNAAPIMGQLQATNTIGQSATNLYKQLASDFSTSLLVTMPSTTSVRLRTFLNGALAISIQSNLVTSTSNGWATLVLVTNTVGPNSPGSLGASNVFAQTFTLNAVTISSWQDLSSPTGGITLAQAQGAISTYAATGGVARAGLSTNGITLSSSNATVTIARTPNANGTTNLDLAVVAGSGGSVSNNTSLVSTIGYQPATNGGPVAASQVTGALTNNTTGLAASATTAGSASTATTANGLNSATTTIAVNAATAPSAGQVLTATGGTAANWQTPSAGSASNVAFLDGNNTHWHIVGGSNVVDVVGVLTNNTSGTAATATSVAITATGDYAASGTSTLPLTGANRQPGWTNAVDTEAAKYTHTFYNTNLNAGIVVTNGTTVGIGTNQTSSGITSATATNIVQNAPVGGVVSGAVTNQIFSTAGTNAIDTEVAKLASTNASWNSSIAYGFIPADGQTNWTIDFSNAPNYEIMFVPWLTNTTFPNQLVIKFLNLKNVILSNQLITPKIQFRNLTLGAVQYALPTNLFFMSEGNSFLSPTNNPSKGQQWLTINAFLPTGNFGQNFRDEKYGSMVSGLDPEMAIYFSNITTWTNFLFNGVSISNSIVLNVDNITSAGNYCGYFLMEGSTNYVQFGVDLNFQETRNGVLFHYTAVTNTIGNVWAGLVLDNHDSTVISGTNGVKVVNTNSFSSGYTTKSIVLAGYSDVNPDGTNNVTANATYYQNATNGQFYEYGVTSQNLYYVTTNGGSPNFFDLWYFSSGTSYPLARTTNAPFIPAYGSSYGSAIISLGTPPPPVFTFYLTNSP